MISTIISWVDRQGHDQLSLHVGGLDSAAEEHVTWIGRSLRLGDEVAVRLVENAKPSRVRERQKVAPRAKEEKAWLCRTAKKYGYRLVKDGQTGR